MKSFHPDEDTSELRIDAAIWKTQLRFMIKRWKSIQSSLMLILAEQ